MSGDFAHIRGFWRDSGFRPGGTDRLGLGVKPLRGLGVEPLRGLGFEPMDAPSDAVEEVPEVALPPLPTQPAQDVPRTYLVGSLLVTALLFLPTGVVAVFLSWRARVWIGRGDLARARSFSRAALVIIIVTAVIGVLVYVALIGALLGLGAFSTGG